MKHRFAHLTFAAVTLAALTLAAGFQAVMSAAPIRHPAGFIEILVDGVAQRDYAHEGRSYIEALKGREYAIRVRNPYAVRVGVALSVDGLNTIDARQTTAAAARKWVLEPYETVTISGWQTSRTEARRFEFTAEERSYGHALGKTANLGVISAVFFKERTPNRMTEASKDGWFRSAPAAPSAAPQEQRADASASSAKREENEYAATGMGERTGHAVSQVWLDLENVPAHTVNIRYEFRPQLVRLGIVPPLTAAGHLERRERARGFEPAFCPEPPRR